MIYPANESSKVETPLGIGSIHILNSTNPIPPAIIPPIAPCLQGFDKIIAINTGTNRTDTESS